MGKLPVNNISLSSDASSSYGMAGVLTFDHEDSKSPDLAGLFWQVTWDEWSTMAAIPELRPGLVEINIAEFLAALITCETFADHCEGRITTLQVDNCTAKVWMDTARCTRAPFDRCAQGIHLHILKKNMKVKTVWISSAENVVADLCSRRTFPWHKKGQLPWQKKEHIHMIAGHQFRRISPKYLNLLRFF